MAIRAVQVDKIQIMLSSKVANSMADSNELGKFKSKASLSSSIESVGYS